MSLMQVGIISYSVVNALISLTEYKFFSVQVCRFNPCGKSIASVPIYYIIQVDVGDINLVVVKACCSIWASP